ncbi:transketolase C-terminal domain-containing protein [Streptomyces sp. SL13]|uniref:Transketolase C-terminal domain-containing protein n=1 Tax=Streptantibioticus silvisoli TaxID=2705255 RepID=A0AA90K9D8_9ACTN|nr:transketolase C-terminal domain-containing protein [Streptantibioticus silvisoli]MDI5961236.1 transketolase C-terminal domain-containing protein [Streptantibioticus silvisoli]MDI5971038.1 transketolase C-terminal domain-containing protein [Streptantibioticus silvisoli]
MSKLSYTKALNRALGDALAADESVCVFGEDVGAGLAGPTLGLQARFGTDRVVDTPLSEQAFVSMAIGAALAGRRPVVELQIPSLLFLTFEQLANQAHKLSLMTGGQTSVPLTCLVPGSGSREGWAGQHSDHPYSLFAHVGIKTVVPATPSDAYGLLASAIRDDDPVIVFAPAAAMGVRQDVTWDLEPVPLGRARIARQGDDVTVVALGAPVHGALAVAEELAPEISVEVVDARTVHPFDWATLSRSLERTGRLVVIDDSNRACGFAAEVMATAAEEMRLTAPPRRVTRPDGAVLPFALELDRALQPDARQLTGAIRAVMK